MSVIARAKRVFLMAGVRLDDPDPEAAPEKVRDEYFAINFPHLRVALIEGPEVSPDGTEVHYRFVPPPVQTKG